MTAVRDGARRWSQDLWYGAHDAGAMAFYDWFRHHGMADIVAPLDGLLEFSQSAGWVWLHSRIAVVSDRPATLHDELIAGQGLRRRLHNASGPSVTYRDGWALHHWHGQLVPAWVIEHPTLDQIGGERNTEIRRCAIESYGWGQYLTDLGVTPVDECPDPGNPGREIALYDLPATARVYAEPVRLLVMHNGSIDRDGTRRMYAETVPATMPDAVTAAAWQYDVTPDLYRALERRT